MKLKFIIFLLPAALIFVSSCSTQKKITQAPATEFEKKIQDKNKAFLQPDPEKPEVFRVLFTSDNYTVAQMKKDKFIKRTPDPSGDRYIMNELKKLDKIDEVREGIISLWLFPDSGNVMKVRPKRPTYLLEIDKLITEDIRRWTFNFPRKYVEPTSFDIKYRVILRKKLSDAQIIKEVQDKMRENQ